MISTLHYYNNYNYFFNKENRERKTSPNKLKEYKNSEKSYFLNKSLNNNIKSYMTDLSSNFNGFKNISNNIYEKISYNFNMESLEEKFEEFADIHNKLISFLRENKGNSLKFKDILKSTNSMIDFNEGLLEDLGIKISEDGLLNIDKEKNNYYSIDKDEIKEFFLNIYDKMCNFMEEPMSNYMNFKDFSYYFNYRNDYDKNKSFKIIEQGMLVDIAL